MNYNQFLRQWRYISEHAYIDLKKFHALECKKCGMEFDGHGEGSTQASNCAASVYQKGEHWVVQGHYGSTVADMTAFKFVKNEPTERMDPVCDYCILTWMRDGDIEYMKDLNMDDEMNGWKSNEQIYRRR